MFVLAIGLTLRSYSLLTGNQISVYIFVVISVLLAAAVDMCWLVLSGHIKNGKSD
jgi:hypothetical protein